MGKSSKKSINEIVEKYLNSIQGNDFEEIVARLKEEELSSVGFGLSRAKVLKEAIWKKYDNNYNTRLDLRAGNMGGPQLHIRNRRGTEWAFRSNGTRSERNRFTADSTTAVKNIVRDIFKLSSDVQIEVDITGASCDKKQLIVEVRLSK